MHFLAFFSEVGLLLVIILIFETKGNIDQKGIADSQKHPFP